MRFELRMAAMAVLSFAALGVLPRAGAALAPLPHAPSATPIIASPSGGVLYDQLGTAIGGFPVQHDSTEYSSEGADDFVVPGPNGWDVSGFVFQIEFDDTAPTQVQYDIAVFADDAGVPSAIAETGCEFIAIDGVLDPSETVAEITLPTACHLDPGTYWVVFAPVFEYPPQAEWSLDDEASIGYAPQWRNPADGWGFGCLEWGSDGCYFDPGNYLFRITGTVAANGATCGNGGICLTVGVAIDDPANPGLCGAATDLDVDQGESVNFCYTVTNGSPYDLDVHSLSDNIDGALLEFEGHMTLAAGGTLQYNRTATVDASEDVVSTWSSYTDLPGYDFATRDLDPGTPDICGDRVFADDFEIAPITCSNGTPGDFIEIGAIGDELELGDDDGVAVKMPFSFNFYEATSNQLCVTNNGFILFATDTCPDFAESENGPLPSGAVPGYALFPYWDDLFVGGHVYTATVGTIPNRRFVVEWSGKNHFDGNIMHPGGITFEVVFGEDGSLVYNYLKTTFDDGNTNENGASATIGVQHGSTLADTYSYNEESIQALTAIDWNARTPDVYSDSDDGVSIHVAEPPPVPPTLTKVFVPATAAPGMPVKLTITLGNDNAAAANLDQDLTDALPAGMLVAATPNASTSCGGTLAAAAGTGTIVLDHVGAAIPAHGTCTIEVDVVAGAAGTYLNTIAGGSLSTDFGDCLTPASAGLTIDPQFSPPTVALDLSSTSVAVNAPSTLTVTLANDGDGDDALTAPFAVALPAGLAITTAANAPSTTCGGALTAIDGSANFTLDTTGSTIPAHGTCAITLDVASATAGAYAITVADQAVQTDHGASAGPVSESLIVTGAFPAPYCAVTASTSVEPITLVDFGSTHHVTTPTVDPGNSPTQSENALNVVAVELAPGGGYLLTAEGNTVGDYSDYVRAYFDWNHDSVFAIDGSESVDIGNLINSTGVDGQQVAALVIVPPDAKPGLARMRVIKRWAGYPTSACGDVFYGQAEDYLVNVDPALPPPPTPPLLASAIAPDYLAAPGDVATLTLTLTNYNTSDLALSSMMLATLAPGLVIAPTPNVSSTCTNAALAANAGDSEFSLDVGTTIPMQSSCTVSVDVTAPAPGIYVTTLPANLAQTANGGNPQPSSTTVQFADPAGLPNYAADFESPTYVVGPLDDQASWYAQGVSAPNVAATMPATGAQHAELFSTSSTSTQLIPRVISPELPAGTSPYSTVSADIRISRVTNGATWEIVPEDLSAGLATMRIMFDKKAAHTIYVADFDAGIYVDTGVAWTQDQYFHLDIVVERATGALDVCIDGNPIYGDASGGSVAGENITEFLAQQVLATNSTANNTLRIDNLSIDNPGQVACPPASRNATAHAHAHVRPPLSSLTALIRGDAKS